jgi:membrane protein
MNAIQRALRAADRFQQRWPVLAFPVAVWSKFNDDQAGNLAALIAYYGFAALFPLLLVLVTVLNIVLVNNPSLHKDLINSAIAQYPVIGLQVKANLGTLPGSGLPLVIGIVLLLLGARGVASAMQNALCEVWGIPKEQRPGFPLSQLWAIALMLTIGIGLVATTYLTGLAGGVGHVINGAAAHVGTVLISLIVNVGMFWLGFRIATAWRVPWRQLRTGAAIAAVCWQVLQLFGGYVIGHQLHRASELYGTFGIVLGLLAWLFLQAEVTLYAAEADVVLANRLWPRSILPAEPDQLAEPDQPAEPDEAAEPDQPAQSGRGKNARPDDRSRLEGQPRRSGQADAAGQAPTPPPRGEPSASDKSDKKAGSPR